MRHDLTRLVAFTIAGLAACSPLTLGETSQYACSGLPDGVVCTGARTMHGLTNARSVVHEADLAPAPPPQTAAAEGPIVMKAGPARSGPAPASGSAQPEGTRTGTVSPVAAASTGLPVSFGAPRPAGPDVLRIWMGPWQDADGNLRMPGHIYADLRSTSLAGSHRYGPNHLQTPEMVEAANPAGPPPSGGVAPGGAEVPNWRPQPLPGQGPPRTVEAAF